MKKKFVFMIVLAAFLSFAYIGQSAKDIPVSKIEKSMSKCLKEQKLKKCMDRDLMHFMEIDPSSIDGYFYYKSSEALSVEELLVIKVKSHNNLNEFRDSIEKRISNQHKTFESYGPKQVSQLDNALIIQKGTYLLYYVGDDIQKIEEVFRNAIQ
ncbi:MAG: DUF4358 domain-containing protein [Eubacterium sp.]|nr:DUF4358 domain-containing protein [Eubacterium sp.]